MSAQPPSPRTEPWPDGVDARYQTIGGATIDLTYSNITPHTKNADAICHGCGEVYAIDPEPITRKWAQAHAKKCRALPRPAVTA
ncbi:hypothetical protein OG235_27880 [Streptomyces sp. NBC_00024]|uniref:hypothetical protein n=1 Tax=Streptomyces sp. NBC_00024 TaxID=2903612 RepID=UPI00324FBAAD